MCSLLAACSSVPKNHVLALDREVALTNEGSNTQPYVSPDGNWLTYVSSMREEHSQPQIYLLSLLTGSERRITFQNGSTMSPVFHPFNSWLLYASSTDELKENPPLLGTPLPPSKLPQEYQEPTELYIHTVDNLEITRLTYRRGFDGEPQFIAKGDRITWTRALNEERTEIVSLDRKTRQMRIVKGIEPNSTDFRSSPDEKWHAWLTWDSAFAANRIFMRGPDGKPFALSDAEGLSSGPIRYQDLAFSKDNQWLLWSQNGELWTYNLEKRCAARLKNDSPSLRHPQASPDGQSLFFVSPQGSGRNQIFRTPLKWPKLSCSSPATEPAPAGQ